MLDRVPEALAGDDADARGQALAELARSADAIVPAVIRAGVADPGFAEQPRPWLDAMQVWGRALQATAAGLQAANRGDTAASGVFADATRLAAEAAASQSILGATRFGGPVKIADGVLDRFVADAPTLIALDVPANSAPTARRAPAWRAQPCAGDAAAFSVA